MKSSTSIIRLLRLRGVAGSNEAERIPRWWNLQRSSLLVELQWKYPIEHHHRRLVRHFASSGVVVSVVGLNIKPLGIAIGWLGCELLSNYLARCHIGRNVGCKIPKGKWRNDSE